MKKRSALLLALAGVLGCAPLLSAAPAPADGSAQVAPDARMAWFRDAKFGMFIHWGLYSIPAGEYRNPKTGKLETNHGEWYLETTKMPVTEYEKFLPRFNPVKFDADAWAQAAADAGVKYLCITSKHHDGFAMFPSKVTENWHFGLTPMGRTGRDPLMELKVACEKRGIAFCLYHTIMDWHHPDYGNRRAYNDLPAAKEPPNMDRFQDFLHASVSEAIHRYHPKMMWFDGFWEKCWTAERGRALQAHLRKEAPDMIFNDRVGPTAASVRGLGEGERFGDYTTPEQFIPDHPLPGGRAWETCMTMNDHWGYNKADQKWKSTSVLVRNLVDIVSKGGNYLLNVGPTGEGEIPEASLKRLAEIGRWTKANGESIYGASASPFSAKFEWGRVTAKGDTLYLHLFQRPANGRILLPLANKALSARLLADGKPAGEPGSYSVTLPGVPPETGVAVAVPESLPDAIDTVIAVKLDGAPRPF